MGVSARALRAGRAVIELSLVTGPVYKGLRDLKRRVAQVGASFTKIGTFGIGTGGFAGLRNLFIGTSATAALAWPVKMAANIEVAAAQLGIFTGDADSARKMLLELQEFSAVSLVPFEELSSSAALLLRYGDAIDKVVPHTKALAVLAAGNADEFQKLSLAFGQVASAGRLQGEEMRQFKNTAFNPLREIAERTGETMLEVKDRMEAGGVSFNEVASALESAVGPGGRFNGLLEMISNTLMGKFRKAWAEFKLAVLPLGDELLAPLKEYMDVVLGILPGLKQWIQQHSRLAKVVLAALSIVAAAAVAFTTLGLSMTVLSIAGTGVATGFSILLGVLGSLFAPISLVAGGIGYLTYQFLRTTQAGRTLVGNLVEGFGELLTIARQTIGGIANALKAGEIQLAGQVLWAGLKLLWLEGTHSLLEKWIAFKDVAARTMIEFSAQVQSIWVELVTGLKQLWADFSQTVLDGWDLVVGELAQTPERFARAARAAALASQGRLAEAHEVLTTPTRMERQIQADTQGKISERDRQALADQQRLVAEQLKQLAAIEAARRGAQGERDEAFNREVEAARNALAEARRRLDELSKAAQEAAENMPPGKEWFNPVDFQSDLDAGLKAAAAVVQPQALFDTRLAGQILGGGRLDELQLAELRAINRNTGRRQGGGLPVV